ncbi:proline-rich extensin-like protein EPR1 isoform X2 [Spodoptera litura]|uniref:Proline-rich extensin-like protein EPR1 isoform X2 n=1 Tax=Spodoptera litura TaxID=69820 RepID=A0A9J7DR56_SPOLT|nr:proline-rich extensin-like protein EPR1 isoform X2 [Spodoptera litura]
MQGGVIGGICLLAFLLSKGRAEETNGLNDNKLENPSDLKNELVVTESNSQDDDDDDRSGAISQSASRNVGGSSLPQAEAGVNSDSGLYNPGANSYPYSPSYSYSSGVNLPRPQADTGYNKATYEGSSGTFSTQQSSPIAFEDAKSRTILPHEYIFPNKMPGGENVIQCTKENEFHHFWSEGVDCMTCICVNEYGVLTPVCASCGGCRKPSPYHPEYIPELPVPIPVKPATPETIPMIPEPYSPEPERPNPEPNLEIPTPEPYPKYPAPIPGPSPLPDSFPEPIPTLPPQPAEASCSPLPNGQPFTNPLHPCQICTCKESDVSGNVDVQIECKENPQCISPVDLTTLPPLPEVPVPIPLPICEKFPEHVLFPHPTDNCKLCKCSKRDTDNGSSEQVLTCYPHPDCIPKPEPATEAVPSLPMPLDPQRVKPAPEPELIPSEPLKGQLEPIEPVPLPEIVTIEPLPWPPITTVSPGPPLPMLAPPPGPLPGPSPHESCRPYPPNQTFQHPWDECQICLCTEATAVGMVTVEVNCYTKPACCIEPPEPVKSAISGYSRQYAAVAPDAQSLSAATSTFRPPSIYPSYTPRTVNYPGTNQVSAADGLKQGYSIQTYPMLQTDTGYVEPPPHYPYQRNYQPPFVNQEYPEYPPRIKVPPASYKPNQFAYPPNYQYAPGDAMENNYAGPQGHYQPYDPRFQTVPSAYPAPTMYQRPNYDRPPVYPPAPSRDVYGKPNQKQIGANVQNVQSNYLGNAVRTISDDDEPDDS